MPDGRYRATWSFRPLGRNLCCPGSVEFGNADLDLELIALRVCEGHPAELGAPVADDLAPSPMSRVISSAVSCRPE